jgi:3-deoxy-manno-octulosonate cytidylyltransferase (CMP-KDO synthetase)
VPRKILGVIPARFSSTRFPGKVLAPISSKPMLQHVYERVSQARYLASTIIATDDERVFEAARAFGARVRMTRPDHISGTDRVAEIAASETAEIIVNIQGDEPLIDPEVTDPNVVKVVTDHAGDAIYFSRCPIPYNRDGIGGIPVFKHIGLYVYQRDFLLGYSTLPVGPLETAERLEQLRALENGFRIRVTETEYESLGVDTPADLERVARLFDTAQPGVN